MKLDEMAITMAIAAGAAWVGNLSRMLQNERRRPSWKMMLLELPSVFVCGAGAGGLVVAMGFDNPMTIAGAGAVAGRIGSAVMMQFIVNWLKRRSGHE
jgi:hypothetical protein